MRIRIDFQLNRQFGVLDRMIFRLVLNGYTDAREIAEALPIFSDSVIANSIEHLINRQILNAQIELGKISLSEPLIAIIEMCLEKEYEINIPEELEEILKNSGVVLSNNSQDETKILKRTVMRELLPDIRMDVYSESIDFVIYGN